jgi:hypothetical protein
VKPIRHELLQSASAYTLSANKPGTGEVLRLHGWLRAEMDKARHRAKHKPAKRRR